MYTDEYFMDMVKSAVNEEKEIQEKGKLAEKILKKTKRENLKKLFFLEGEEFYTELLSTIGLIQVNNYKDSSIVQNAQELIDNVEDDKVANSGKSFIKLVASKILGFCKFLWNTLVVVGACLTRTGYFFFREIGKAIKNEAINVRATYKEEKYFNLGGVDVFNSKM